MRPAPGEVLQFSEDPTITRFVPHVAATSTETAPYVWAVGRDRAPDYWFPRQCPRAMAWALPETTDADRLSILGPGGGSRVHAVEYRWLEAIRRARLYAYRLPADRFRAVGDAEHAMVATAPVAPLGPPEPVGDLFALHDEAGIQLRLLPNLWPFWDAVVESTLGFSGIRLRNAAPRPHRAHPAPPAGGFGRGGPQGAELLAACSGTPPILRGRPPGAHARSQPGRVGCGRVVTCPYHPRPRSSPRRCTAPRRWRTRSASGSTGGCAGAAGAPR
jgi:hypothetical protein